MFQWFLRWKILYLWVSQQKKENKGSRDKWPRCRHCNWAEQSSSSHCNHHSSLQFGCLRPIDNRSDGCLLEWTATDSVERQRPAREKGPWRERGQNESAWHERLVPRHLMLLSLARSVWAQIPSAGPDSSQIWKAMIPRGRNWHATHWIYLSLFFFNLSTGKGDAQVQGSRMIGRCVILFILIVSPLFFKAEKGVSLPKGSTHLRTPAAL